MKLYNSLTKKVEEVIPVKEGELSIYSCGPTVYNNAHIGNLMSYIVADTIARVARISGLSVNHVMNITDVDDKTIAASDCYKCPDKNHNAWLKNYTDKYTEVFYNDLESLNINRSNYTFTPATDYIDCMVEFIAKLEESGIAYAAEDGIYFSINEYKNRGSKYGQLVEITTESTGAARINNDEYDKEDIHDFALWKKKKDKEPFWEYKSSKTEMIGRPGWHTECSAMSSKIFSLPFDIHTGGIDLKFPHHENEIAQSTALSDKKMANYFIHSEHLLVDNVKMSKSKNNFYVLDDIAEKGFEQLAFRLLVLRSKYNTKTNFTWDLVQEAQAQLNQLRNISNLQYQFVAEGVKFDDVGLIDELKVIIEDDLNTPLFLSTLIGSLSIINPDSLPVNNQSLQRVFEFVDSVLGLDFSKQADIEDTKKTMIADRQKAKSEKDFERSDELREELLKNGIEIIDTASGPVWQKTY